MKYNLETTTVQYFKHLDGTEIFFRGKFSPEAVLSIDSEIQELIDNGSIEIIEREEEVFVEEVVKHVVPLKDYKVVRRYPALNEQLDMLWHEINTTGTISHNGNWFNNIKEIKDNHPKPNN
jgi:hypothetical protein